jgi:hypothetical protein
MKLNAKEDVAAPIAFVSAYLTDFKRWENAAMRRGAQVKRLDSLPQPGPGMEWKINFDYREQPRELTLRLQKVHPEQMLAFDCTAKPAEASMTVELLELGPRCTRIKVVMEVKPRTLTARLFLQSLRLAKAKVSDRFAKRLAQMAADIEDRHSGQAQG